MLVVCWAVARVCLPAVCTFFPAVGTIFLPRGSGKIGDHELDMVITIGEKQHPLEDILARPASIFVSMMLKTKKPKYSNDPSIVFAKSSDWLAGTVVVIVNEQARDLQVLSPKKPQQ